MMICHWLCLKDESGAAAEKILCECQCWLSPSVSVHLSKNLFSWVKTLWFLPNRDNGILDSHEKQENSCSALLSGVTHIHLILIILVFF